MKQESLITVIIEYLISTIALWREALVGYKCQSPIRLLLVKKLVKNSNEQNIKHQLYIRTSCKVLERARLVVIIKYYILLLQKKLLLREHILLLQEKNYPVMILLSINNIIDLVLTM